MKNARKPYIGSQFDSHQMDEPERVQAYIDVLEYFRPRGFSKLVRTGQRALVAWHKGNPDAADYVFEFMDACDSLLTDWARRVERHDYIYFSAWPYSGDVGFSIDVESAQDAADFIGDSDRLPKGFSGLAVFVNDHGNATCATYSRGRKCRELFAVV